MADNTPRNSKSHASKETKLRAVEAVLQGTPRSEVAHAYGIDRATLYRWIIRYRTAGQEGLTRKPGSGRPPRTA